MNAVRRLLLLFRAQKTSAKSYLGNDDLSSQLTSDDGTFLLTTDD